MKIVVPLDGSEFSTRAIPPAAAIATAAHASITLVGVAADGGDAASLEGHLREAARLLPPGAASAQQLVLDADPVAILLDRADAADVFLCVASHDRMPEAAAIRGSVGSHLIERAR